MPGLTETGEHEAQRHGAHEREHEAHERETHEQEAHGKGRVRVRRRRRVSWGFDDASPAGLRRGPRATALRWCLWALFCLLAAALVAAAANHVARLTGIS